MPFDGQKDKNFVFFLTIHPQVLCIRTCPRFKGLVMRRRPAIICVNHMKSKPRSISSCFLFLMETNCIRFFSLEIPVVFLLLSEMQRYTYYVAFTLNGVTALIVFPAYYASPSYNTLLLFVAAHLLALTTP